MNLKLMWLGASGLTLSDPWTTILLNPYVNRYSYEDFMRDKAFNENNNVLRVNRWMQNINCAFSKNGSSKNKIKGVVAARTDLHYALDAPFFAKFANAKLIGSESLVNLGRSASIDEDKLVEVGFGSSVKLGRFNLRFYEAIGRVISDDVFDCIRSNGSIMGNVNYPTRPSDYCRGPFFNICIKHPLASVLYHGSTKYMKLRNLKSVDYIFLNISFVDNIEHLAKFLINDLKPKAIFPINHDDPFLSLKKEMVVSENAWENLRILNQICIDSKIVFMPLKRCMVQTI